MLLPPQTLLVLNDTRVIPARLKGRRSPTGGVVEILLVEPVKTDEAGSTWRCLTQSNRPLKPGQIIEAGGATLLISEREPSGTALVQFDLGPDAVLELLKEHGEVPLPPYIGRQAEPDDVERYQTVFARHPGAVAAPTAGLHFTPELIGSLTAAGHELCCVTLHVGPGTFRPITSHDVEDHVMDSERYSIPDETARAIREARQEGRSVLAVGTTVVRTLEDAADKGGGEVRPGEARAGLFIMPGFEFRVVDLLMTNFHLPRSTLLALVYAFSGAEKARRAYEEAVSRRYRFYSYGDAMLIR